MGTRSPSSEMVSTPEKNTDNASTTNCDVSADGGANSGVSGGGCPMKRADGSYSYNWSMLWKTGCPHMRSKKSDTIGNAVQSQLSQSVTDTNNRATMDDVASHGCPVTKSNDETIVATTGSTAAAGCPVTTKSTEYNVYAQPIDPTNNIPRTVNQLPAAIQTKVLSTERVASSIPKGGAVEGTTWTYPSPQMFFNALARKGKIAALGDDEEQEHMETVVALHNNMNELTWQKILEWEALHHNGTKGSPPAAKLLKFQGRPSDLSPKAWFKHHLLGHPLPFDRHDWTVLRQDGRTVRYVMDYYYDEPDRFTTQGSSSSTAAPSAASNLLVDVRPALDDPSSVWSRCVMMPYARFISGSSSFEPLPLRPSPSMKAQVAESIQVWSSIQSDVARSKGGRVPADATAADVPTISEDRARELANLFSRMDCQQARRAVSECTSDRSCARASMDLTMCMAKIVCPLQYTALVKSLQTDYDAVDTAMERVSDCVELQTKHHILAKQQHPSAFA